MPEIIFSSVNFEYEGTRKRDGVVVFNDFSEVFPSNSFNVIIGPSGCGKTTLLRLLLGFIDDYSGDIYFDKNNLDDLSVKERNLAYISQNYALYPHLTIFDNIAFPLKAVDAPREEIISRVFEIAKMLDLTETLSRKPKYLSGGQKQRVAIARGLVKRAKLFLFDEPLSNVDPTKRVELRQKIKQVIKENNATALYVTHDFSEAMSLADYIYVMDEGKIVVKGTPEEVYESGNELVNSFIRATFVKE